MADDKGDSNIGARIALGVGLGCLGGAIYIAVSGGSPIGATILVLIGASALSGWSKARNIK